MKECQNGVFRPEIEKGGKSQEIIEIESSEDEEIEVLGTIKQQNLTNNQGLWKNLSFVADFIQANVVT